MKDQVERSSRVTRRTSENRQSGRSSSGRAANRGSTSVSPYPDRARNGRKRKCQSEDTSSSKKSNSSQDQAPKAPKRMFNNMPGDAFCWICHTLADEYFCPDCRRVYHNKCLKKIKFQEREPVCECKWTSVDGPKSTISKMDDLKELLTIVLRIVHDEKTNKKHKEDGNEYLNQLKVWPEECPENSSLCDIVDIRVIVDKIKLGTYKNTGQFFLDVKRMYHNSYIAKGSDHIMTTTAQKFEKAVKLQLSDMEACSECYQQKYSQYPSSDFFTNLCSTPHSIVWAKLKGFPFWPAKCLRIVNGHADVRFFGTHDKSLIPLPQVYKISRRNPGGNPKKPKNSCRMTSYEESLAELSVYISNYDNFFGIGKFRYYNDKTPLEPVKSSGKKGRQNKNQSQLEDSMDTNADVGFIDQSVPHLNVSLLHDDVTETKASFFHSSVTAAMNSSVVCHMICDIEESPSEVNTSEVIIEDSSCVHLAPQLPEVSGQVSDDSVADGQSGLSNSAGCVQNGSNTFSNIDSSVVVPCTSSSATSSPLVITSTRSLSDVASDTVIDCDQDYRKVLGKILDPSALPELLPTDGDDEIQVVLESQRRSLVENFFKNKPMVKTFCEMLLGNKPNVRNYVASFQNMALQFYLAMWLEANTGRLDTNECKMFHGFCEKLCKTVEVLKCENRRLKSQVTELEKKLLSEKLVKAGKASLRDQIIRAQAKKNCDDALKFKDELNRIFSELSAAKKNVAIFQEMLAKSERQVKQLQQENKVLKQDNKVLKQDNEVLKQQKETSHLDFEKQKQADMIEHEKQIQVIADLKEQLQNALTQKENLIKDKEKIQEDHEQLKADHAALNEHYIANKRQGVENMERFTAIDDGKSTRSAEKSSCTDTNSSFVQHTRTTTETTEQHSEVTRTEETCYAMLPQHQLLIPPHLMANVFGNPVPNYTVNAQLIPENLIPVDNRAMYQSYESQSYESRKSVEHSSKQSSSRGNSQSSARVTNKKSMKEQKKGVKISTKKR